MPYHAQDDVRCLRQKHERKSHNKNNNFVCYPLLIIIVDAVIDVKNRLVGRSF